MPDVYSNGLFGRLFALLILVVCLIAVSRNGGGSSFESQAGASTKSPVQEPTITAQAQANQPLAITSITSAGTSPDFQGVEFAFYVINVSPRPILAYAIRQDLTAGGKQSGGGVTLYNPQLANSVLRPNQSVLISGTADLTSDNDNKITLSVDYVEFSDGTRWGADSVKSSERVAGQRAAATMVGKNLLEVLKAGKNDDVTKAIEDGKVIIQPPGIRSQEWNEGFSAGRASVLNRLKRANEQHGLKELELELRRIGETFKENE
jgi:hypothetical protein